MNLHDTWRDADWDVDTDPLRKCQIFSPEENAELRNMVDTIRYDERATQRMPVASAPAPLAHTLPLPPQPAFQPPSAFDRPAPSMTSPRSRNPVVMLTPEQAEVMRLAMRRRVGRDKMMRFAVPIVSILFGLATGFAVALALRVVHFA